MGSKTKNPSDPTMQNSSLESIILPLADKNGPGLQSHIIKKSRKRPSRANPRSKWTGQPDEPKSKSLEDFGYVGPGGRDIVAIEQYQYEKILGVPKGSIAEDMPYDNREEMDSRGEDKQMQAIQILATNVIDPPKTSALTTTKTHAFDPREMNTTLTNSPKGI
jgi:hypothetical protein